MLVIQNNYQDFYKKIKNILNNSNIKFLLSAVASSSGIGVTKLIYDKISNIGKIEITPADIAWIKKNIVLIEQDYPLCWHNAFMQFLACPEILYRNYKSEKIMVMIRWIRERIKELNENYNGDYLDRKIKLRDINGVKDRSFRRAPDGVEHLLNAKEIIKKLPKSSEEVTGFLFSKVDPVIRKWNGFNEFELGLLDGNMGAHENYSETIEDVTYSHIYDKNGNPMNKDKNLIKNSMNFICAIYSNNRINSNILGFFKNYNLYPTFIIVYDDIDYDVLHAHVCYIVYNKNKNPKFFIWCDGFKNKIIIKSVEESIKKIKMYKKKYIKYSTSDIVETFYTP